QVAADHIGPEIHEILQRAEDFRDRRAERTVFDSTGWAVEDDIALRLAVRLAEEHDLGLAVTLERLPEDPYDPYATA
ncbi:MAG: ornithine cyclodeaminase family protein, partial [Actinomycetota bacterium]